MAGVGEGGGDHTQFLPRVCPTLVTGSADNLFGNIVGSFSSAEFLQSSHWVSSKARAWPLEVSSRLGVLL